VGCYDSWFEKLYAIVEKILKVSKRWS